jgi:hypothetical protein
MTLSIITMIPKKTRPKPPVITSKWLEFHEYQRDPTGTRHWFVFAKVGRTCLGEIRWYGPWRQYAFYAWAGTVLTGTCFADLKRFCWLAMAHGGYTAAKKRRRLRGR